jgi:hypothetical protein
MVVLGEILGQEVYVGGPTPGWRLCRSSRAAANGVVISIAGEHSLKAGVGARLFSTDVCRFRNGHRPPTVLCRYSQDEMSLLVRRLSMSAYTHYTDGEARCAFCVKPLPVANGELRPRAASGQFFCTECSKITLFVNRGYLMSGCPQNDG